MNPSTRAVEESGTLKAVSLAGAKQGGSYRIVGMGVVGWSGLFSVDASHSVHRSNSFARSVTVSENRHQVGGFGDPPKVRRRAMNAKPANRAIDCIAAYAE